MRQCGRLVTATYHGYLARNPTVLKILPQVLSLTNLLRKITLQLYVVFLCMTGIPTSTMMSLQTGLIRSSSKTSHECNRVSPSRKWSSQLYPLKTKKKVTTGQSNLGRYLHSIILPYRPKFTNCQSGITSENPDDPFQPKFCGQNYYQTYTIFSEERSAKSTKVSIGLCCL